jgi:RimJ/RimL family protein N-acetyltransferase
MDVVANNVANINTTGFKADRSLFAALHADPEVMRDLGGPIGRAASDTKLANYRAAFCRHGFSRWAIETRDGNFLGYAGVMPSPGDHPLGAHFQIGWRLVRDAWGKGYATEAAAAALHDAFARAGLQQIVAYTERENKRSQAVMNRLQMTRDPSRDFTATYDNVGVWHGLVWVARPVKPAR